MFGFYKYYAMFGSQKILEKDKKNIKQNCFFMFGLIMDNIKENKK